MSDSDLFDRNARRRRIARCARGVHLFHARVSEELLERQLAVRRPFAHALVLGSGAEPLAAGLRARGMAVLTAGPSGDIICDEDRLAIGDARFDLVISPGGLDTVNDLPGALHLIRRSLTPNGLFLAAFPAAGSLPKLRAAALAADIVCAQGITPHLHPQIEVRSGGDLLTRAGFVMPVADCETTTIRYTGLGKLIEDLRATGTTSVLPGRRTLARLWLKEAALAYAKQADPDGRVSETLVMMYLSGWAPAPQS
jgi:NADH dehydrogenase [ubiquinone] 1 alpha subcomplex assembly factor 5